MKLLKSVKQYMEKLIGKDNINEEKEIQNKLEKTLAEGFVRSNRFIQNSILLSLGAALLDYLPSYSVAPEDSLIDESLPRDYQMVAKFSNRIKPLLAGCRTEKSYQIINRRIGYIIDKYDLEKKIEQSKEEEISYLKLSKSLNKMFERC